MIDLKSIRIGNLLKVDKYYWEVIGIDNDDPKELYFKENDDYNHYLNAEPIEITEEWMDKLGFTIDVDKTLPYIKAYNKNGVIFDSEFILTVEGAESELHSIGKSLKYIHQLQNLYYSLTGQELEINQP